MSTLSKKSMSGGEIAPALYARTDLTKYTTGLRTLRNNYVLKHGGTANRSGTKFVCEVNDSTSVVKLIPFEFNDEQTYVLEFGEQYMRVIKQGVQLTEFTQSISNITQANPAVVTYTGADNFLDGNEIFIFGVSGMTQINGRSYKIANVNVGLKTFELQTMDYTNLDSTSFSAYISGGNASIVYEIETPYAAADVNDLQYVQSADVITLVHPSYPPYELSRLGDTNWTIQEIDFLPNIARPTYLSVALGAAGSNTNIYTVTTIRKESFEESLHSLTGAIGITGITNANPCVVTHGGGSTYTNGDIVYIDGVVGMEELNGREFTLTSVSPGVFTLQGIDSTGYGVYSSGGTISFTEARLTGAGDGTPGSPHVLSWPAVPDAEEYNVYRKENGIFGLIGVTRDTSFNDIGIEADTTTTPPIYREVFEEVDDYPSTVTYIQQRLAFANTNNDIEKVFLSRVGDFKNFTYRRPTQADDSITFTMAGREVNSVNHLLDLNTFVIMTSGGEFVARGNDAGILTPTDINTRQQTYNGSTTLKPITIGSNALYVQARGSIIRDLGFNFDIDGYQGNDLTIFSTHLFQGYQLVDWAYTQVPDSIVWAVRNDGTLLGLTYVKEQEVLAWHRHDFEGGLVENVVSVPEDNIDILYLVIKRTINGRVTRYIERMSVRQVNETTDIIDKTFMDSHLTYDGRNTGSTTMLLTGGTDWTYLENLTLTASASTFLSTDIGNEIHITSAEGEIIRLEIVSFTSDTVVTVKPNRTVPVELRNTLTTNWAKAVDMLSGLWHLEGKDITIFADRYVVSNPNNDSYDVVTVTNGAATLARPYAVIHAGLPYTSDIETLDIDTPDGETLVDKSQKVSKVTLYIESTRGGFVGPQPPDETVNFLDGLDEIKYRNDEGYDEPISLETGTIDINIRGNWKSKGRIFIRQTDPIPMSILAIAPSVNINA